MRTLDRYVIRSFLFSALMWLVILLSLRVLVDMVANMDEFTEGDAGTGTVIANLWTYYSWHTLVYFIELGAVIITVSAAFTLGRMNHTNELTAMLASGVSLRRVFLPIFLCTVIMAGLVVVDQELIIPIPEVRRNLLRDRDELAGRAEKIRFKFLSDGGGGVWYGNWYDPTTVQMDKPLITVSSTSADDLYEAQMSIAGQTAEPAPKTLRRKLGLHAGWVISPGPGQEAIVRRMDLPAGLEWDQTPTSKRVYTDVGPARILRQANVPPNAEHIRVTNPEVRGHGKVYPRDARGQRISPPEDVLVVQADRFLPDPPPAQPDIPRGGTLYSPRFSYYDEQGRRLAVIFGESARWVPVAGGGSHWELTGGKVYYETDLRAEDIALRETSRWLSLLSYDELDRLLKLKRLPDPSTALLAKHLRIFEPLNKIVLVLLAVPFILSRERNLKASAAMCLLTVLAFYAFIYVCRYMGLSPMLAAALPSALFGPVAVLMFDSVKT